MILLTPLSRLAENVRESIMPHENSQPYSFPPTVTSKSSPRHTPATILSPISSPSHLLTPAGGSFFALASAF